jgi:hypothetical protein
MKLPKSLEKLLEKLRRLSARVTITINDGGDRYEIVKVVINNYPPTSFPQHSAGAVKELITNLSKEMGFKVEIRFQDTNGKKVGETPLQQLKIP